MVGWANPRCSTCGRNQMWMQRNPLSPCVREAPGLPFDDVKARPAQAARVIRDLRVRGQF
jgi:hypothetical protein